MLLDREAFISRMRDEGRRRYHDQHPFHRRMHAGELDQAALQCWVLNRYYYQTRLPIKDALIVGKSDDPAFRRLWLRRIVEQDGASDGQGGLEMWLKLADGVGLDRAQVKSLARVEPAVRFACDAYVTLVRDGSLLEAIASSLTEWFSPELMSERVLAWERHYTFIDPATLSYFRARPPSARAGSEETLERVLAGATTRELQERCIAALVTKCQILWAMLDAIEAAAARR
jgi:pyrroloquinoline-quinone synthase